MQTDEEAQQGSSLYTGNHKKTAFLHVVFKIGCIIMYLLGKLVMSNFILCFILLLLLSAADFWVVKNITGRVLVGLRWWNFVRDDGESEWVFESVSDRSQIGAGDSTFFWMVLFGYVLLWLPFTFMSLLVFEFKWVVALCIPLGSGIINAYGYSKCKKDWKKQGAAFALKHAQENPEMAMAAMTTVAGAATASSSTAPAASSSQQWGGGNVQTVI